VLLNESGVSPDEIISSYPHLTLADVYAALAYYHDNREIIDAEILRDRATYQQAKAELNNAEA
jgi:uncharacterized protein (DUF433 family)